MSCRRIEIQFHLAKEDSFPIRFLETNKDHLCLLLSLLQPVRFPIAPLLKTAYTSYYPVTRGAYDSDR